MERHQFVWMDVVEKTFKWEFLFNLMYVWYFIFQRVHDNKLICKKPSETYLMVISGSESYGWWANQIELHWNISLEVNLSMWKCIFSPDAVNLLDKHHSWWSSVWKNAWHLQCPLKASSLQPNPQCCSGLGSDLPGLVQYGSLTLSPAPMHLRPG